MTTSPRFSVILPVYNRATTIDRCLQSIAGQTYPAAEVIVVNDGSTDDSAEAISRWESRLPRLKLVNQNNAGVAAARNVACEMATGDWLAFIDSDDEWRADKLEQFSNAVAANEAVDFVHSDRLAADGKTRLEKRPDIATEQYEQSRYLCSEWAVVTSTLAARRSRWPEVGPFQQNLYSCSDYEWFWRYLAVANDIRYLAEPLTIMHNGPLGMARSLKEQSRLRDNLRAMGSAITWIESSPSADQACAEALRNWRKREFKALIHQNLAEHRYMWAVREAGTLAAEMATQRFWYRPTSRDKR